MAPYVPTIGLEIHAELKTRTKMFCNSLNDPDEDRPNVNVCPVCMAHPGTLPVVNREAVKHVLKVGTALGGSLADYTEFDRKNYFYPDQPKGYQISQYEYPLVKGGELNGVKITRIHLEEDTATSKHRGEHSLVDFNRAGVPLMELVTEPVIHDAVTAGNFARELQLLLRTIGAGDANMEKGQMRVEANISVSRDSTLGTKTEVKNLNSFKSVERAIEYEIARQIKTLEEGGTLLQETRGFDESTGATFSQRLKESSHDYRYFPDPDIPKFKLSVATDLGIQTLAKEMPELPWARRIRYAAFGIQSADVEVLIADPAFSAFFETEILAHLSGSNVKLAVNYLLTDVRGTLGGVSKLAQIGEARFAKLILMIESHSVSSRGAKDILAVMLESGDDPAHVGLERGLMQESGDEAISKLVEALIAENGPVVAEIKSGKEEAMKFLVGQGMKLSKGSANPTVLTAALKARLSD